MCSFFKRAILQIFAVKWAINFNGVFLSVLLVTHIRDSLNSLAELRQLSQLISMLTMFPQRLHIVEHVVTSRRMSNVCQYTEHSWIMYDAVCLLSGLHGLSSDVILHVYLCRSDGEGESLRINRMEIYFPLSTSDRYCPSSFTAVHVGWGSLSAQKGFIDVTQLIYNTRNLNCLFIGDIETTPSEKQKKS